MRGALLVAGTTSDAGKSWVVAGLCRLLARAGVSVAPFKAQNMALHAAVAHDGGEIGHAQFVQALAAGATPEVAMNPVLLKPTGERTSQVVVMGRATGVVDAAAFHATKAGLWPVVLDALDSLRGRFDVVVCEGAGGAGEVNLLDGDLANLPLARAAGIPAVVVGDIERGGVFASLYGTVAIVPPELAATVRGFVVNRFRGDPALLAAGTAELERRTGVPTLGVVPVVDGIDLDAEDSLALERQGGSGPVAPDAVDVAVVRLPRVANVADLDPLRVDPRTAVRWVRSAAELGRPDLVVLPGSKATRDDLAWLRDQGLDTAVAHSGAAVLGICAGAQLMGVTVDDPSGVEGPAGTVDGLGWLNLHATFEPDKVLDRPSGRVVAGPGLGRAVGGYRIHHGRVRAGDAATWLEGGDGAALGWHDGRHLATTLHGVLDDDGLRAALVDWAATRRGRPAPSPTTTSYAAVRTVRLDSIADALAASVDLDRLWAIIGDAAPATVGAR